MACCRFREAVSVESERDMQQCVELYFKLTDRAGGGDPGIAL
jgi:hypothetical protein